MFWAVAARVSLSFVSVIRVSAKLCVLYTNNVINLLQICNYGIYGTSIQIMGQNGTIYQKMGFMGRVGRLRYINYRDFNFNFFFKVMSKTLP